MKQITITIILVFLAWAIISLLIRHRYLERVKSPIKKTVYLKNNEQEPRLYHIKVYFLTESGYIINGELNSSASGLSSPNYETSFDFFENFIRPQKIKKNTFEIVSIIRVAKFPYIKNQGVNPFNTTSHTITISNLSILYHKATVN